MTGEIVTVPVSNFEETFSKGLLEKVLTLKNFAKYGLSEKLAEDNKGILEILRKKIGDDRYFTLQPSQREFLAKASGMVKISHLKINKLYKNIDKYTV